MAATIVILLVLAALSVYGIISYRKTLKSGCCGSGDAVSNTSVTPQDADPQHYPYRCTVTIEGMHCANCARAIENAFNAREGLLAKVTLGKRQADVRCMQEPDEGLLRQIVAVAGYHVTAIKKV